MTSPLAVRPTDATLTVTKAARLLGVHPNTIRAWSDAGRLRYYRINPRGDRRYRMGDLQRFLVAAEPPDAPLSTLHASRSAPDGARQARRGPGPDRSPTRADRRTADVADHGLAASLEAEAAREIGLIDAVTRLTRDAGDLDEDLQRVANLVRAAYDHHLVAIWALRDGRLAPRAVARSVSASGDRLSERPRTATVLGAALADLAADGGRGRAIAGSSHADGGPDHRTNVPQTLPVLGGGRSEAAVAIVGLDGPWGVLHLVAPRSGTFSARDLDVASTVADAIAGFVSVAQRQDALARRLHRAEALQRVASDIGSRLDIDRILSGLVDHAMVLFAADRGAVFLQPTPGQRVKDVSRGLSERYVASVREAAPDSLPAAAIEARRAMAAEGYRDDPRATDIRAALVQEGFDTMCTAPLLDAGLFLGRLDLYHDAPHAWTAEDLATMTALATQAAVAIRSAQDFERMERWTAQLQSIQQLGNRLNRLTVVRDIGEAIATELRQLIDCHNVRVYREVDHELIPVAMQGQVGEYIDETPDQLRTAVGKGITGWVAEHAIAQNLGDAGNDPRANTIPGTDDDLDESMLLAPMVFDDRVLGVLVLSKLGLDQFTDDDLRLLVIYASFAAQAMANADTTEQVRQQSATLERQVRGQRELLDITESIVSTLDGRAVLESITERLEGLVAFDNIAIEIVDRSTGRLAPLTARGVHAANYLEPWEPGEAGVATWVVEHNEALYIADERDDPRVNHFRDDSAMDGSLVVVPLRGREGAIGVLTMERLGAGAVFAPDEFELIQLFAAQVSIALQNAEIFRAVEIRAQTDGLTGLLNHGTFEDLLARSVTGAGLFSLIMVDLDDFKAVNDTLGHQAGDEVLRAIGSALVSAGRDTDQIFRYGGDEFSVLLPGTDAAGARHVAERVAGAVRDAGGGVTASIGIATFPVDGEDARGVLLAADRACYVAKRKGHGRIATAEEGRALAAGVTLQEPTPIDPADGQGGA